MQGAALKKDTLLKDTLKKSGLKKLFLGHKNFFPWIKKLFGAVTDDIEKGLYEKFQVSKSKNAFRGIFQKTKKLHFFRNCILNYFS